MSSVEEKRQPESMRQASLASSSEGNSTEDSSSSSDTEVDKQATLTKTTTEEVPEMPAAKMYTLVAMLFTAMFLVSLDRLIIGVAIPSITNEFDSLADVGWYGTAYLLTFSSLMLFYGRMYTIWHPKWIYIGAITVFEIGSAICGAAPSSNALIIGRAVAGMGGAGIMQGALILVVYIVPLHKRPAVMGFGGLVFGVSSVIGPLLGGAFTDGPGWRWVFYVNLPFGGLVVAMLIFFFHIPEGMLNKNSRTWKETLLRLDIPGTLTFLPAVVCLLLALQWGGTTYPWGNYRVVVCLVFAAVLFLAFALVQMKSPEATIPGRVLFRRAILAGLWFGFFSSGAMQTFVYYLPTWFQAVKGTSAVKAGIDTLPMVLGLVITTMGTGIATRKIGYFAQWMYCAAILAPIGAGMITTFNPSTGHAAWIGFQALYGLGVGFGMQQPSLAAQTCLPRKDVSAGLSLMKFVETFSGSIWIAVGENLFEKKLASGLASIPNLDPRTASAGATEFRKFLKPDQLGAVVDVYNAALKNVFYLGAGLVSVIIFGALAMEWLSVKKDQKAKEAKKAAQAEEQV